MTLSCSVDLETWSTRPNALIVSIGAVKFDPLDPDVPMDAFHVAIDPSRHVVAEGAFHIDPDTMLWWLSADRAAARTRWLSLTKMDIGTALDGFAMWLGTAPIDVWGNGATFDNVILTQAYKSIGQERPWGFRNDRCYRTLKALAPEIKGPDQAELEGVPHDALYDAMYQAVHAGMIMRSMVR